MHTNLRQCGIQYLFASKMIQKLKKCLRLAAVTVYYANSVLPSIWALRKVRQHRQQKQKTGCSLASEPDQHTFTAESIITMYSEQRMSINEVLLIGGSARVQGGVRFHNTVDSQTTFTDR